MQIRGPSPARPAVDSAVWPVACIHSCRGGEWGFCCDQYLQGSQLEGGVH